MTGRAVALGQATAEPARPPVHPADEQVRQHLEELLVVRNPLEDGPASSIMPTVNARGKQHGPLWLYEGGIPIPVFLGTPWGCVIIVG